MTRSVIICEGGTDLVLLQYFMETVCRWSYVDRARFGDLFHRCKRFEQGGDELYIGEAGGCAEIPHIFHKLLESNKYATRDGELYNNIIIVSDRDEVDTVSNFAARLERAFKDYDIDCKETLENDKWINCNAKNAREQSINFKVLTLIIPFETTGALETFLLQAIAKHNEYDKTIIQKSEHFINAIDPEQRYLKHRRDKTKAKFDVYFSVRTSSEQFSARRDILKSINWQEYELIQTSFLKLHQLVSEKRDTISVSAR